MTGIKKVPRAVAVVGLGKLGAPMAAAIAARGIDVIGVDQDSLKVGAVNRGEPPVAETMLAEYIQRGRRHLKATTDFSLAVTETRMAFIIVPTPSDAEGRFSLGHLLPACEEIGRALRRKKSSYTVIITSTVFPGSTGGPIRECLEKASGKRAGKDFGLCYSPEFIALGSVIRDFLNPDFILVGESDPQSGKTLEAFYHKVCENKPHVARMNFVNAELSKLAVNTYVTTKITYANMLAHLCERLPGGIVDVVTEAIGHDSRIGPEYLRGATGYGGPCFPRDNIAMGRLAKDLGLTAALAETTDRENRAEVRRLTELVKQYARSGSRVGVLGLSYKPDTEVVEESQGLLLAQMLLAEGFEVNVFDPLAMQAARVVLGDQPRYCGSAEECVRRADVVVVATPWKEFARLPQTALKRRGTRLVMIDAWRIAPEEWHQHLKYVPLGVHSSRKKKFFLA